MKNLTFIIVAGCVSSNYSRTLIAPCSGHFELLRPGYTPLKRPTVLRRELSSNKCLYREYDVLHKLRAHGAVMRE